MSVFLAFRFARGARERIHMFRTDDQGRPEQVTACGLKTFGYSIYTRNDLGFEYSGDYWPVGLAEEVTCQSCRRTACFRAAEREEGAC